MGSQHARECSKALSALPLSGHAVLFWKRALFLIRDTRWPFAGRSLVVRHYLDKLWPQDLERRVHLPLRARLRLLLPLLAAGDHCQCSPIAFANYVCVEACWSRSARSVPCCVDYRTKRHQHQIRSEGSQVKIDRWLEQLIQQQRSPQGGTLGGASVTGALY